MFKVKGGDNNEYGPVSTDQIRAWVRENRLNQRSQAQRAGEADWRTLDQFPEFADLFPPPVSGGAPPVAQPGDDEGDAAGAVKAPAICLIIYAALSVPNGIAGFLASPASIQSRVETSGVNIPPQFKEFFVQAVAMMARFAYVQATLNVVLSAAMLYGAVRMLQVRSRPWAIAAGCIAVFPCGGGCCCLLGIPLGIWALVVLARPEVRRAFPAS